MALRDWVSWSGESAAAVSAVFAAQNGVETQKTATTATTATANGFIAERDQMVPELPTSCPLLGGPVPSGCRFESRFFRRMVQGGDPTFIRWRLPIAVCLRFN